MIIISAYLTIHFLFRTFGIECSEVQARLIDIIRQWTGPDNCKGGGEKCLYKVNFSSLILLRCIFIS